MHLVHLAGMTQIHNEAYLLHFLVVACLENHWVQTFLWKKCFPRLIGSIIQWHSDFLMEILQGISQNIKTADIFSKLGNYTSIYQRSPPWLMQTIFLLAQPIEHWKMPSWEKNISEHDIKCTQITTDKCFCSQVAIKQSTVFFLWMIALKTNLDQIRKFKYLWKWCIMSSNKAWLTLWFISATKQSEHHSPCTLAEFMNVYYEIPIVCYNRFQGWI